MKFDFKHNLFIILIIILSFSVIYNRDVIFQFGENLFKFGSSGVDISKNDNSKNSEYESKIVTQAAKNYKNDLEDWLYSHFEDLSSLSKKISEYLSVEDESKDWSEIVNKAINEENFRVDDYSGGVYVIDKKGFMKAQRTQHVKKTIVNLIGRNYSHRLYFRDTKNSYHEGYRGIVTDVFTSGDRSNGIVVLAVPIERDGKFFGIVDVVIDVTNPDKKIMRNSLFSNMADEVISSTISDERNAVLMLFDRTNNLLGMSNVNSTENMEEVGKKIFHRYRDNNKDKNTYFVKLASKEYKMEYGVFCFLK